MDACDVCFLARCVLEDLLFGKACAFVYVGMKSNTRQDLLRLFLLFVTFFSINDPEITSALTCTQSFVFVFVQGCITDALRYLFLK